MALWPASGQSRTSSLANTSTSSGIVVVTASATPHTMGSWVTLISSTAAEIDGLSLFVLVTSIAGQDTSTLIDVGVGAGGSERVIVTGIQIGWIPIGGRTFQLPIRVPAGVRIAARIQSVAASKAVSVGLALSGTGGWGRASGGVTSDTYGAVTGSSNGTALTDPGSINTKAGWTELTSATNRRHKFLLPLFGLVAGETNAVGADFLYDVGIGASGSEVVVIPDLYATTGSPEDIRCGIPAPIRCDIPSGTRLAARVQKGISTGHQMSMVIIGFD